MAQNKQTDQDDQESYVSDEAASTKASTTASRNMEKLGQDESYSVISEDSLSPGDDSTDEADEYADVMDNEELEDDGVESTVAERREGVTQSEDDDDVEIVMGTEADVTDEDLALLGDKDQDLDGGDDEDFNRATLDETDEDGDPLNEASPKMSATGDDLDMPDDGDELPGDPANEDEENKYYSLGSDSNDNVTEGTP